MSTRFLAKIEFFLPASPRNSRNRPMTIPVRPTDSPPRLLSGTRRLFHVRSTVRKLRVRGRAFREILRENGGRAFRSLAPERERSSRPFPLLTCSKKRGKSKRRAFRFRSEERTAPFARTTGKSYRARNLEGIASETAENASSRRGAIRRASAISGKKEVFFANFIEFDLLFLFPRLY